MQINSINTINYVNYKENNKKNNTPNNLVKNNANISHNITFKGVLDSGLQKILEATKSATTAIDNLKGWKGFWMDKDEEKRKLEEQEHQQLKGYALAQQEIVALLEQQSKVAEAKLEEAKKNNASEDKIRELEAKAEQAEKTFEVQKKLMVTQKNRGWDRISGYEEEKAILTSGFIQLVGLEQAGNNDLPMPNGVLFFGPTGNGKTTFAKAFAEQAQCPLIEIDMLNIPKFEENLIKAAEKSLATYEKDGKRTIILLDEFESVGLKAQLGGKPDRISSLKSFMQSCAEKYKCTLFLTTNNPLDIDPILIADARTPIKVFLDPPNKSNAKDVFGHYLKNKTNADIDLERLSDEILKVQPERAYSNSRIKKIVESCYKERAASSQEMTEDDVILQIASLQPDILEEHLIKYEEEKQKVNL